MLDCDPRWFERGVKEAIYIQALRPSLNKDGGRFHLSEIYTKLVRAHTCALMSLAEEGHSPVQKFLGYFLIVS